MAFAEAQDYPVEVLVDRQCQYRPDVGDARKIAQQTIATLSLLHQPIQGKGAAVRKGMLEGRGEYLFICDADLAMPIEQVVRFLPPQLSDYRRRHRLARDPRCQAIQRAVVPPRDGPRLQFHRPSAGRARHPGHAVWLQVLRRECRARRLLMQKIDGWAFDVEILYIALRRGYRVVEVPINWYYGAGSRVSPMRDSYNMVREVFRIRRHGREGYPAAYDHLIRLHSPLRYETTSHPTVRPPAGGIGLRAAGYGRVAGLDEAGRGAWAGPVFAAPWSLPLDRPDLPDVLAGVRDSKLLQPISAKSLLPPHLRPPGGGCGLVGERRDRCDRHRAGDPAGHATRHRRASKWQPTPC